MVWLLQDLYNDKSATTAKRMCGAHIASILDMLINVGANYIDLRLHNDFYYLHVIPLDVNLAYTFVSKLGTRVLCDNDMPFPNSTIIDSILLQSDDIHRSLTESSIFFKLIATLMIALFTTATLNKNKITQALQNFSLLPKPRVAVENVGNNNAIANPNTTNQPMNFTQ